DSSLPLDQFIESSARDTAVDFKSSFNNVLDGVDFISSDIYAFLASADNLTIVAKPKNVFSFSTFLYSSPDASKIITDLGLTMTVNNRPPVLVKGKTASK
ncbi:MAG: hypothetical protein LBE31_10030, partial [Deltaproteobacteria bacterium]|nr:hypothetical protein [Deltaproteobacteria bacterium]